MHPSAVTWYPKPDRNRYHTHPKFKRAVVKNCSNVELQVKPIAIRKQLGKPLLLQPVTPFPPQRCLFARDHIQNNKPQSEEPSFEIDGDDPLWTDRSHHHNLHSFLPSLVPQPPQIDLSFIRQTRHRSHRFSDSHLLFDGEYSPKYWRYWYESPVSLDTSQRRPRILKQRPKIPRLWQALPGGENGDLLQTFQVKGKSTKYAKPKKPMLFTKQNTYVHPKSFRTGMESQHYLRRQTSLTRQWLHDNHMKGISHIFLKNQIFICDLMQREDKEWCNRLRQYGVNRDEIIHIRTLIIGMKHKLNLEMKRQIQDAINGRAPGSPSKSGPSDKIENADNHRLKKTDPKANGKRSSRKKGQRSKKKQSRKTMSEEERVELKRVTQAILADKVRALFRTSMARKRHLSILWMSSVLGMDIVKGLMDMFSMIDADFSGDISRHEVELFNVFLSPFADIQNIKRDTELLFRLADEDHNGRITEIEWLEGWTLSAARSGGDTSAIEKFLDQFRKRKATQTQVASAFQFEIGVLVRILKWARKRRKKIKI